jgi:hypothetical protein
MSCILITLSLPNNGLQAAALPLRFSAAPEPERSTAARSRTAMKIKKIVIGGVLLVIGLPVALIAVAMAWFRMEGKTNGIDGGERKPIKDRAVERSR